MIPKIIHYCWFGKTKLPKSARKCIDSWKKQMPDYEIKEWNESNFNINQVPYVKQAYNKKKYAFVSDYARFYILYYYGGIYFDTDVELLKPIYDLVDYSAFMGCEIDGREDKIENRSLKVNIVVSPGLGMGSERGNPFLKKMLECYQNLAFVDEDGKLNLKTIGAYTTESLMDYGMQDQKGIQYIYGIMILPKEYFNPFNNNTGNLEITDNTRSIHWYNQSWSTPQGRIKSRITRIFHRAFGEECFIRLRKTIRDK